MTNATDVIDAAADAAPTDTHLSYGADRGGPSAAQGLGQRRTEAERAGHQPPIGHRESRHRRARRADPTGRLLRYPGPDPEQHWRRGSGPPRPAQARRLDREDQATRPRRGPARGAQVGGIRRRGGCHAGRLRLLGHDEGPSRRCDGQGSDGRRNATSQIAQQGAASALLGVCAGGVHLDDLRILGPINVLKVKCAPKGYGRRLVAELWLYPDGSRILELSTKCRAHRGVRRGRRRLACSSASAASTCSPSSRPRPGPRSSSSPRNSRAPEVRDECHHEQRRRRRASNTIDWYRLSADDVCRRLDVDPAVGLSAAAVLERRQQYGPNKLAEEAKEPAGEPSCASTAT